MRSSFVRCFAITALAVAGSSQAAPKKTPLRLPPVERCTGDASFDTFRAALRKAVGNKDVGALKAVTAPDIQIGFGGDDGWKAFAGQWGLAKDPKASDLWKEMALVLARGCAKSMDGGRVFPSNFEDLGDDLDAFEAIVALPGAVLRAKPDAKSASVAKLDWHTAQQLEENVPEEWVAVRLLDGRKGYIDRDDVISPLSYRLAADKKGGRWLITAFVAGD